jgi:hypothetical protein
MDPQGGDDREPRRDDRRGGPADSTSNKAGSRSTGAPTTQADRVPSIRKTTRAGKAPAANRSTRPRRLLVAPYALLPALLLVTGVGSAIWGYEAFRGAVSSVPSLQRQGEIVVFATDDNAITLVEAALRAPRLGDERTVGRLRLTLWNASLKPDTRWAVAITRPSKLPSSLAVNSIRASRCGFSGPRTELSSSDINGPLDVADGEVNGVPANVIVGGRPDQGESLAGAVPMCIEIPLSIPVAGASSSEYVVNAPRLGHAYLPGEDQPVAMSVDGTGHDFGPVQNPANGYSLSVSGYEVGDQISTTRELAAPNSESDWVWTSDSDLSVQARVARPSMQSRQQRESFIAGVLISLSTALFLWALELILGPDRESFFRISPASASSRSVESPS